MFSKRTIVVLLSMLLALTGAGCLDLFAVPGVAVSPDGSQIYFLTGSLEDSGIGTLAAANLSDGSTTTIMEGNDDTAVGAFAVNPTNGDVAFVASSETTGTSIMVYSGGQTSVLIGPETFATLGLGTHMQYSPDGSKLALTMVSLPPGVTSDMLDFDSESDTELTPEQFAAFTFDAWLIDVAAGTATIISASGTERVNTVSWSADSRYIAYNAFVDSNGDGTISTVPNTDQEAFATGDYGDLSQIHVYDTSSGSAIVASSNTFAFAPAFVSATQLAYVSVDFSAMMTGGIPGINLYDVGSGSTTTVYQSPGLVLGISVSPDWSQVAWFESTSEDDGDSLITLNVAGADFSAPHVVTQLEEDYGIPDLPVWLSDGSAVLISSTSILSSLMGQITASFSFSTDTGEAEATAEVDIPMQQVRRIDLATGESTVVFEGLLSNSTIYSGLIGITASGAMEDMFSDLEGE